MADESKSFTVLSTSPHAHSGDSVRKIMLSVIIALVPALAMSLYFFRWDALRLVLACVLTCVISEAVARKIMKRDLGITDLSAVITGLLLAFNLPPGLPTWMAVLGSAFAIVVAKQLFGGIGYNPFNPALIGRVFLLVSFPVPMTTWSTWTIPSPAAGVNATTTATPLGMLKTSLDATGTMPYTFDGDMIRQLLFGARNGCIGETAIVALVLGGLFLLVRRCIYWQVPFFYLGTVAVFSGILWKLDPAHNMNPLFHLLTGGVVLGAFFMATDMVTSPVTKSGMIVFGIGCGLLTMIIRKWGGYPEGCSFAILIMNSIVPLINKATRPRVFGHIKKVAA